jgi:hypothetical protein
VGHAWKLLKCCLTLLSFTSTESYLNNSPRFREDLESRLKIPRMFFDRMLVQSNGFAGHSAWLSDIEELEFYSEWHTASSGN